MLITVLVVIFLVLAIGIVIQRSYFNKSTDAPKQAPPPLKRLQATTDIEAALEYETYKHNKETSVNLLQHEMKENQRKFDKQFHNDLEKLRGEMQSKFIHIQKENQIHLKKANEKMQDWIKDLLHAQRKELQDFFQKTNNNIKQDIKSDIQSTEQHIQREIRIVEQSVKEDIQKATLQVISETAPKPAPKATAAEEPKEPITENLEKYLNKIEMTENQLQTNVFDELNHQLVDAHNTVKQIQAHLEVLDLLHALECEFKTDRNL
jgi:uncharacterized coiled-coil protein SlyX